MKLCAIKNPVVQEEVFKQTAEARLNQAMNPPEFKSVPNGALQHAVVATKKFLNTQRKPTSQLSNDGFFQGFFNPSASKEEMYEPIKSASLRASLESAIVDVQDKAGAAAGSIMRSMQVDMKDLGKLVHQISVNTQGLMKESDIFQTLYKLRQAGSKAREAQDLNPLMKQAVEIVDRSIQRLSDEVLKHVKDPETRKVILENYDRYVFRQFSIHKDPQAIYRQLDRATDPYKAMFAEYKTGTGFGAKFREMVKEAYGDALRKAHPEASEMQLTEIMDRIIDNRIHGEIAGIVKENLRTRGMTGSSRNAVAQSGEEYLIKRELTDKNLRAILGEETHAQLAVANLAAKVAHDVKASVLRNGIVNELYKHGLASDVKLPGLDARLNRATLLPFTKADDIPGAKDLYVHAGAKEVLQTVEQAIGSTGHAMTQAISLYKLTKVASIKNFVANTAGAIQTAASAAGIMRSSLRLARNPARLLRDITFANQVAKEIAFPGSAGVKPGSLFYKQLRAAGFKNVEEIRAAADDLVKRGLDVGGEFHAEFTEGIHALTEGAKSLKTKSWIESRGIQGLNIYKMPDVAAKVFAYRALVEEAVYKAGVKSPTEEMLNWAAKQTLKLTQDPRTTATGVRNLSRGATGLATGGFQGFYYQSTRNLANAVKLGAEDAYLAMHYINTGDVAKAKRYAAIASDRLVTSAISGYFLWEGLESFVNRINGFTQEEVTAFKELLRPEERNSTVWVTDQVKGKDGDQRVTVFKPGTINIYDNTMQVVRTWMKHGVNDPLRALQESKDIILSTYVAPGLAMELIASLYNARIDGNLFEPWNLEVRPDSYKDFRQNDERFGVGAGSVGRFIKNITPTQVGRVVQAGKWAYDTKFGFAWPEDAEAYEKSKSKLVGNVIPGIGATGGMSVERFNMSQAARNRFTEEYKKETWLSDTKRQYKEARTIQEQTAIIKAHEEDWDRMQGRLLDLSHSLQRANLSRAEVYNIMKDKEGYIGMPKSLAKQIALGQKINFRSYLDSLK